MSLKTMPADYRATAQECLRLSELAAHPDLEESYKELADAYNQLADIEDELASVNKHQGAG